MTGNLLFLFTLFSEGLKVPIAFKLFSNSNFKCTYLFWKLSKRGIKSEQIVFVKSSMSAGQSNLSIELFSTFLES